MHKHFKAAAVLMVFVMVMTFFAGCGGNTKITQTTSSTTSESITIANLGGKDVKITVDELKSYSQVSKDVTAVDSAGQKTNYKVKGPLLEDVLKKHGQSQKELKGMRFTAGDGYSVDVPQAVLKSRDIILALEINGKPLDSKNKPVRAIIPEERAMYWVRNLTKIEILNDVQKDEATRIILLDTASKTVPVNDYKYYDKTDKAFKIQDLFSKYGSTTDSGIVFIKAADKLQKTEKLDIFSKANIKFTGQDAPLFIAPDLPLGMHVKNIVWFMCGHDVYLSVSKEMDYFTKTTIDGKQGISMKDLVKEGGLNPDTLVLKGLNGSSTEIAAKDLENGVVYLNDSGDVCTYFKGLPGNTSVKGLLSIEAKK